MNIRDIVELASALNSKGNKKIALKWNDRKDLLFIQEEDIIKPIRDSRFDELMDKPAPEPMIDAATIELLKSELDKMRFEITSLIEKDKNNLSIRVRRKPAPLTKEERTIEYYRYLYNNDLGQGDGKIWPGMPILGRRYVEARWKRISNFYQSIGYWI